MARTFSRSFKHWFARICVALLLMQAGVAAYACPIVTKSAPTGAYAVATAHDSSGAMSKECSEPLRDIGGSKLCHQHYAGELSGGMVNYAFAPPASEVPIMIVGAARAVSPPQPAVPSVFLHRATGPSLAIRFQVLRI